MWIELDLDNEEFYYQPDKMYVKLDAIISLNIVEHSKTKLIYYITLGSNTNNIAVTKATFDNIKALVGL